MDDSQRGLFAQATDARWMDRALELARGGEARASPNPMVGAVLVQDTRVVGEGFHTYDGRRHAEILALEAAGRAARGATLYINLEPCCITGRTGPCTLALIAAGVRRVVAAIPDPNPKVAGRSLKQLRGAGIAVKTGIREVEARRLNEAFACWITQRRPLVTLKSALTLDGQIALPQRPGRAARWITSSASREEVQRLRHASDAVLTGIGTVLSDDPRLTDRTGQPRRRKLLRVVMDSRLRLPLRSKLVKSADGDLLVFTTQPESSPRARALRKAGVEIVRVRSRTGQADLRCTLAELGRRDFLSVLLEAGGTLNGAALVAGLVDKMLLFYAPKIAGAETMRVIRASRAVPRALLELREVCVRCFGPDLCVEGYFRDVYRNR